MNHSSTRIWYVTDIHGSTKLFDAFLRSVQSSFRPNVLILGGDLLGSGIVSIVEGDDNTWFAGLEGDIREIHSQSELEEFSETVESKGLYPHICDKIEAARIKHERSYREDLLKGLQRKRLSSWLSKAADLAADNDTMVIINGGHSDPLWIDRELESADGIIWPEGSVVELPDGSKLISTGWSISSPFNCPRETSEELIEYRLNRILSEINSSERLVFNCHTPPQRTQLDKAPRIDEDRKPAAGIFGPVFDSVGSLAIKQAIQKWQPLLSLHGLVHERPASQPLGNTIAINPGSEYYDGWIRAAIAEISSTKGLCLYRILRVDGKLGDTQLDEKILKGVQVLLKTTVPILGNVLAESLAKGTDEPSLAALYALELAEIRVTDGDFDGARQYASKALVELGGNDLGREERRELVLRANEIIELANKSAQQVSLSPRREELS